TSPHLPAPQNVEIYSYNFQSLLRWSPVTVENGSVLYTAHYKTVNSVSASPDSLLISVSPPFPPEHGDSLQYLVSYWENSTGPAGKFLRDPGLEELHSPAEEEPQALVVGEGNVLEDEDPAANTPRDRGATQGPPQIILDMEPGIRGKKILDTDPWDQRKILNTNPVIPGKKILNTNPGIPGKKILNTNPGITGKKILSTNPGITGQSWTWSLGSEERKSWTRSLGSQENLEQRVWDHRTILKHSHEEGQSGEDPAGVEGVVQLLRPGVNHGSIDHDPPACEKLGTDT
ncbi:hypothetical protein IHE44_0004896, partial [Lamprotornis superbus]